MKMSSLKLTTESRRRQRRYVLQTVNVSHPRLHPAGSLDKGQLKTSLCSSLVTERARGVTCHLLGLI